MVEASPCKVPGPSILKSSKNVKTKNEIVDDNDPASEPLIKRKDDSSHKLGHDLKKHGHKSNEMKNNDSFSRPLLLESPEFQRKDFGVSTDQSLEGIQMKVAGEHTKETCHLVHKENLQKVAEISQLRNTCISSFSSLSEHSKSNILDETINNSSSYLTTANGHLKDTGTIQSGGISKSQNKMLTKPAVVDASNKPNDIKTPIGGHGSVNPVPINVAMVEIEEGILHAAQKLATLPQQKNMLNDVCPKTSGTSNRRCVDGATIFTIAKMGVKQDDSTKACQSIASPISSFSEKNDIIISKLNESKTPSSSAKTPVITTVTPMKPFQASNMTKINPTNIICSTPKTSYQHSPYIFKDEKPATLNKLPDSIAGSSSKDVLQNILVVSDSAPRDLKTKNDKSQSMRLGEIQLKNANQSQEKKSPESPKDKKSISSELKLSIAAIKTTMASKSDIIKVVPEAKNKILTGAEASKGKESQQPSNSITQGDYKSSKPISSILSISSEKNRFPEAVSVLPSISKSVDDKVKKCQEVEKYPLKSSISKAEPSDIQIPTGSTKQSEKSTSDKAEIVQSVLEKSKISEKMQEKDFNCNPSKQVLNKQNSNLTNITNSVSKEIKSKAVPLSAMNKLINESKKVEPSISLTQSEIKPTQSVPLAPTSKLIDSSKNETTMSSFGKSDSKPHISSNTFSKIDDQKKGELKGITKNVTKTENVPAQSVPATVTTKLIDNKKVDSTVTPSVEKKENKPLVLSNSSSKLLDDQMSGKSKGNIDLSKTEIKPAQNIPLTVTSKLISDPKKMESSDIKNMTTADIKPTTSVSLSSTSKTNVPMKAEPKSVVANLCKPEIKSSQPVPINVTRKVISDPKKVESSLVKTEKQSIRTSGTNEPFIDPKKGETGKVAEISSKIEIKPTAISKFTTESKKSDVIPSLANSEPKPAAPSGTGKLIAESKKGEPNNVVTKLPKSEINPTALVSPAAIKSTTDQKKSPSNIAMNLPKAESKAKQEIPPTAAVKMILNQNKGEPIVIITDSAKLGNKNDTVAHSSAKAIAEENKAGSSEPKNIATSNQSALNKSSSNIDTEKPSENTKKNPSVSKSVVKLK